MANAVCTEAPTTAYDRMAERLPVQRSAIPAVIMAGGYGKRLEELTRDTPKPMVHVAGRPALDHVVDHLEDHGVKKAALALHYLPHKIRDHCRENRENGMGFHYSVCEEDYGTAGGVLRAARLVEGDPILVVSGDLLTDMDLTELVRFHRRSCSPLTIALTHVEDARPYGVPVADHHGRIYDFEEKPAKNPDGGAWINAGIYVMDRAVLGLIPSDRPYDISRDLIPALLKAGIPIYGCYMPGYWFDIGTPATLREAEGHIVANGASSENGNGRKHRRETLNFPSRFLPWI